MKKRFALLASADLRQARRDPMLELLLYAPILILGLVRFGLPPLQEALLQYTGFDLTPHYPFVLSMVPMLMPLMVGMVVGFILLDERDENILAAIAVTSLSRSSYLIYKTLLPLLYSSLLSFLSLHLAGQSLFPLLPSVPGVIAASLLAPCIAFFLAAYAENKVSGLVLAKAAGFLLVFPVIAYLLPAQWTYLLAPAPTFWLSLHLTALAEGKPLAWPALAAGLLLMCALLMFFIHRFEKRAR
jgi:fluoroquinolone transport system permease protein